MQMNLRVKFTKENYLKYISHLDLMRLFQRTFRRGNIPIKYSEGFNPQPKLSIANPLALGISSVEEYMDIELYEKMSTENFINRMNEELPEDIRILDAKYIEGDKSISSLISWSYYEIEFKLYNLENNETLERLVRDWLGEDKIVIKKIKHKGKRIIEKDQDIRPLIGNVVVNSQCSIDDLHLVKLNCLLKAGDNGNLKPIDFIKAMDKYLNIGIDFDTLNIKRIGLFMEHEGKIESPL